MKPRAPIPLLSETVLFLGEIPRQTDFEQVGGGRYYQENGEEKVDRVEEDTAIAIHLRGKGLVILSGCAHSGIINTVIHAKDLTDVNQIHTVMGGFHLPTPAFDAKVEPTIKALKEIDRLYHPDPLHRPEAILQMEKAMPDRFIRNMTGTRLIFEA